MTLHKTLLAVALAVAGVSAAGTASAEHGTYATRDQIRMIEREYADLHGGRVIPDNQLEYYLDRANSGWTMDQIRRDMAGYSTNRNAWRPQQGWVAREVVCTSIDGRYRECAVPFRGQAVVTQQISDAACVEGRTWGQRAGTIWVNRGCRARFGIVRGGMAGNGAYGGRDNRTVVCASNRGVYRECNTGFRGQVYLSRQLNNSNACVEGRTWGQRTGTVWVRGGCRAQFESVGRRGPRDDDRAVGSRDYYRDNRAVGGVFTRDPGYFVTCNSVDGQRAICSWDSRYGEPRLIERLSRDTCVQGQDWGYTARGELWVDSGCRARFGYR